MEPSRALGPVREALMITVCLLIFCAGAASQTFGEFSNINGTLVKCHTTALNGKAFILEVKKEWAPLGAERFLALVESGFFTDCAFFRVVTNFLTQFGITPDRSLRRHWREQGSIKDDPSLGAGFKKGYLSFAGGGPNTRDTQLFIALADSDWLGKAPWEVPVGRVIEGMDVLEALYAGYGDIHPFGTGPDQQKIWSEGNEYLQREYPRLDYFKDCSIIPSGVKESPKAAAAPASPGTPVVELRDMAAAPPAPHRRTVEVVSDSIPARPEAGASTVVFVIATIVIALYCLNRVLKTPKLRKAVL